MTIAAEKNPPVKLPNEPAITPQIVAEHGLAPDEYERLLKIMGRTPTMVELGIFSAMWSEHCSYKSSKVWLKKLPTKAPWVIQGPGENAGVIDIGDGQAAIFKMESHNHPSYIEPYQGAATGVGGILRDVFTMGARPVANLNALRFGDPKHPKTRHLVSGVVAGIGGYGNCMGIPTVGGETNFHAAYNGNILVNAMTVGIAPTDRIFYAAAAGVGNPLVYVGSKTGRDGIHGATMASTEFNEDSEEKRPTVQVGDPFVEKLLLEACLELMATDAIVAIQDMGAAGLTSSSFEMAAKGGLGVVVELDKVPMRETGMNPYELMLSESQERMLIVLKPGREELARSIFEKWELDFAVIGHLTDTERMVLSWHGEIVGNIPIPPLVTEAPVYERPWTPTKLPAVLEASKVPAPKDWNASLLTLMSCPDLASKAWIWHQYDHRIMGNTAINPQDGDAAVVRVPGVQRHQPQGPRDDLGLHAALCAGPSRDRRPAGRRRSLAQHHGDGCPAARRHRQHEFRQPAEARDHGPVRRRHHGHGGGLQGPRLPGRVGQRLALQRDRRPGDPADAHDRRGGRDRRHLQVGRLAVVSGWPGRRAGRRDQGLARPVALPARGLRPRRGRPSSRRPRGRTAQRRLRARPDRPAPGRGLS